MSEDEIRQIVKKWCELGDEYEEEVTNVTKKLLSAMNWSISEIHKQEPMQGLNGKLRADFLIGNEADGFIIELKSPTVSLSDDRPREQLRAYLLLKKVKYGVLYNGHELLLMIRDVDKPVYEWNCEDDKEDISIFLNLSKGNYPNNMENFIAESQGRSNLKAILNDNQEKIKDSITGMISADYGMPVDLVRNNIKIDLGVVSKGISLDHGVKAVPKVSRKELTLLRDGLVIICPSDSTGPSWLKRYYAWRSVKISRKPIYFALYVSWPYSKVLYFGEIETLVDVEDKALTKKYGQPEVNPSDYGKKAIILKPGSLKELSDPISIVPGKRGGIMGPRYSSLDNFVKAVTIEDLSFDD